MVAARATRSNMNVFKLWLTDRGTFPVVLIAGTAATAATVVATRFLFYNPDAHFNKYNRKTLLHHDADTGSSWRQFRYNFANYDRNRINQSRQHESLHEKFGRKEPKSESS
ncbi:hypothetical protein PINS_up002799 [Pythium insidiosum]|nr:hypothetical protein PINS_up002799 [Pythium insidiosum]